MFGNKIFFLWGLSHWKKSNQSVEVPTLATPVVKTMSPGGEICERVISSYCLQITDPDTGISRGYWPHHEMSHYWPLAASHPGCPGQQGGASDQSRGLATNDDLWFFFVVSCSI